MKIAPQGEGLASFGRGVVGHTGLLWLNPCVRLFIIESCQDPEREPDQAHECEPTRR